MCIRTSPEIKTTIESNMKIKTHYFRKTPNKAKTFIKCHKHHAN